MSFWNWSKAAVLGGLGMLVADAQAQETTSASPHIRDSVKTMFGLHGYEHHSSNTTLEDARALVLGDIHGSREASLAQLLEEHTRPDSKVLLEQPEGGYMDSTDLGSLDQESLKWTRLKLQDQLALLTAERENTLYGIDTENRSARDVLAAEQNKLMTAISYHKDDKDLHPVEQYLVEQNYGGFKSDTTTQLEEIRSVQNATADSIESARQDSIEANILQHLQAGGHSVIVTGNNHVTDAIGEGVAATLEQSDIPYVAFTEKDNGEETTWDEAQKYSFDAFIEPYLRSHGLEEYIDEYRERFMQVPAPDSTGKH